MWDFKNKEKWFIWLLWVLVVALGIFDLCCSMRDILLWHVGSMFHPYPGMERGAPALGARSLSHWAIREVPAV